jgi:hypothetical protein
MGVIAFIAFFVIALGGFAALILLGAGGGMSERTH